MPIGRNRTSSRKRPSDAGKCRGTGKSVEEGPGTAVALPSSTTAGASIRRGAHGEKKYLGGGVSLVRLALMFLVLSPIARLMGLGGVALASGPLRRVRSLL